MKVKNNYTSHLGFGATRIVPGETAPLPEGYDNNHPVVAYYISRKWLKVVGDEKGDSEADGNDDNDDGETNNDIDGLGDEVPQIKPISRMNRDELLALAGEMGLEFTNGDTNPELRNKIKAAQKAEE